MATGQGTRQHLDEQVAEVATRLREIVRGHGLSRTLAIGQLVLERFYGGDEREWRARRSKKNNSIRVLAARPDCPLGKSALNEAVGVYVAVQLLPFVRDAKHIGACHVAAVLRLPPSAREYWLSRAERERLSVRELRGLIVSSRRQGGERRGRPGLSAVGRAVSRVRASLKLLRAGLDQLETVDEREQGEMDSLLAQLDELRTFCENARSQVFRGTKRPAGAGLRAAVLAPERGLSESRESGPSACRAPEGLVA